MGMLAFVLLLALSGGDAPNSLVGGMACFGISVLPAIIGIGYIQTTTIRAREITDRSITLVRVHEEFVEAMDDFRQDRKRDDARPRRRQDDDDLYEDDDDAAARSRRRRDGRRRRGSVVD